MSNWATHQLTWLLTALSASEDEAGAIQLAIEHAASAVEGEVGAFVRDGAVVAAVGFARGAVPEASVIAVVDGDRSTLDVPGAGSCRALATALDGEAALVVARAGDARFTSEEVSVLHGLARVLSLALHMQRALRVERTLREERDRRHRVLENLSGLQRAIAQRRPLQEVLDAVVGGASSLLGDDIVALLLVDAARRDVLRAVATAGVPPGLERAVHRRRSGEGVGGAAFAEERLVVAEDYDRWGNALDAFVGAGVTAAMAAPVREESRVVGSLSVASTQPGRRYTDEERELLVTFAEHVSLAMNDAKTIDEIQRALHDPLTGLPNRALFLDRLEHALRASGRGGGVAVLFVDLDGFKTVNDSLGHAAGDALLGEMARRIESCIRTSDTAARLGGDEFAILVEGDVTPRRLVQLADEVIDAIRSPFRLSGRQLVVAASMGIDIARSPHEDPHDIIRNADVAMYRAKSEGKGRSALFEPSMHESVLRRLELEADLRHALDDGELDVHYQPIVSLVDERIAGVEALVRWHHPTRGWVPPSTFVPIAEETGLVGLIDMLALRRACMALRRLPEVAGVPLYACVNISARHLHAEGLAHDVAQVLRETGVDPSRLVVEITESVLMRDAEVGRANLRRLRDMGVRIAIDDFGVGFSSLSYLRDFPVDVIKIDKSFIDEIADPTEATLALAIISLGHALELSVVAEGIETEQQLAKVRSLACDLGQGSFFADAVSLGDLLALVEHGLPGTPLALL